MSANRIATVHALWVLLSEENERDGFALKPMPWAGPGEYRHVTFSDGQHGLVRVPSTESFSTTTKTKVRIRTATEAGTGREAVSQTMLAALNKWRDAMAFPPKCSMLDAKNAMDAAIAQAEAAGLGE